MSKIRCFCAVDVSEEVKNMLKDFQTEIRECFGKVSWTRPEGLHITMKFLGDQEESDIEKISHALSGACSGFSKVKVDFGGVGFFPGPRRPRVIWVGVESGEDKLVALNKKVEDYLAMIKIPREGRKFRPHLTLGRIRKCEQNEDKYRDIIQENRARSFGSIVADRLYLMQSLLKPGGAEYIKLKTYEFN